MTAALYLMVGHVGAGKSTEARRLEREARALRLTPDEWMMPLFGHPDDGKRDVLEGLLLLTALDTLRFGSSVILDFGLWSRNERAALHWLGTSVGAEVRTTFLDIDLESQWERVEQRWAESPESTWRATREDLLGWRALFEEPDEHELAGRFDREPPFPHAAWSTWMAQRWSIPLDRLP